MLINSNNISLLDLRSKPHHLISYYEDIKVLIL